MLGRARAVRRNEPLLQALSLKCQGEKETRLSKRFVARGIEEPSFTCVSYQSRETNSDCRKWAHRHTDETIASSRVANAKDAVGPNESRGGIAEQGSGDRALKAEGSLYAFLVLGMLGIIHEHLPLTTRRRASYTFSSFFNVQQIYTVCKRVTIHRAFRPVHPITYYLWNFLMEFPLSRGIIRRVMFNADQGLGNEVQKSGARAQEGAAEPG